MRAYWTLHKVDYDGRTKCGRKLRRYRGDGGYLVYDEKCSVCFPAE